VKGGYILNHRYKAKMILSLSSFFMPWHLDLFGIPQETAWVPEVTGKFSYPMGLIDRLWNLYLPLKWTYERETIFYPLLDKLAKKTYNLDYTPSVREIERNASLIFINNHFGTTDLALSLPPFVVDVAGMQAWKTKTELPKVISVFFIN